MKVSVQAARSIGTRRAVAGVEPDDQFHNVGPGLPPGANNTIFRRQAAMPINGAGRLPRHVLPPKRRPASNERTNLAADWPQPPNRFQGRDGIRLNHHRALGSCLRMIVSEKPLHTFPDHALELIS
jgi:hypothetical protein